ncbi:MAG: hypothetical protein AB7O86_05720 [Porticoccaceae bacterium]
MSTPFQTFDKSKIDTRKPETHNPVSPRLQALAARRAAAAARAAAQAAQAAAVVESQPVVVESQPVVVEHDAQVVEIEADKDAKPVIDQTVTHEASRGSSKRSAAPR